MSNRYRGARTGRRLRSLDGHRVLFGSSVILFLVKDCVRLSVQHRWEHPGLHGQICPQVEICIVVNSYLVSPIKIERLANESSGKRNPANQVAWIAVNDIVGIAFRRPPTDRRGEFQRLRAAFAGAASEVNGAELTLRKRAVKNINLIHLPHETILDCCITAGCRSSTEIKRV